MSVKCSPSTVLNDYLGGGGLVGCTKVFHNRLSSKRASATSRGHLGGYVLEAKTFSAHNQLQLGVLVGVATGRTRSADRCQLWEFVFFPHWPRAMLVIVELNHLFTSQEELNSPPQMVCFTCSCIHLSSLEHS